MVENTAETAPVDAETWFTGWIQAAGFNPLHAGSDVIYGYGCDCGCLMMPSFDDVAYLDRYMHARGDCTDGLTECPCHTMPSTVPIGTGIVTWYLPNAANVFWWGAGFSNPRDRARCTGCGGAAVSYVNAAYNTDGSGGPRWVCADALGTPVPDMPTADEMRDEYTEPDRFRSARQQAEIMLAACPDITCR